MDTPLLVNHAVMERGADDLLRSAQALQARLDTLDAELAPLRSEWSGHAQSAYAVAHGQWTAAMAEMIALLTEVARAVATANEEYRALDLRGAQRF